MPASFQEYLGVDRRETESMPTGQKIATREWPAWSAHKRQTVKGDFLSALVRHASQCRARIGSHRLSSCPSLINRIVSESIKDNLLSAESRILRPHVTQIISLDGLWILCCKVIRIVGTKRSFCVLRLHRRLFILLRCAHLRRWTCFASNRLILLLNC